MDDLIIRRLKKEDAEDISRIDSAITKKRSKLDFKRIVEEEVEKAVDASYVAELRGKVVGYMINMSRPAISAPICAWIAMFGVDPKIMGQGRQRLAEEIFKFHKSKDQRNTDFCQMGFWTSSPFQDPGFEQSNFINLRKPLA
jgi:hypothetical protein